MYYNGEGVDEDFVLAAQWYRKAADQGCGIAQYNLGVCYHNGQGVCQSLDQAKEWYYEAAKQGYRIG